MKIDIEAVEELLTKSGSDIYPEDYLSEYEVEEGSEEEELLYENFTSINNYIIKRLKTRLSFMKHGLKNEDSKEPESYCEACQKYSMIKVQNEDEDNTCEIWDCQLCDNEGTYTSTGQ